MNFRAKKVNLATIFIIFKKRFAICSTLECKMTTKQDFNDCSSFPPVFSTPCSKITEKVSLFNIASEPSNKIFQTKIGCILVFKMPKINIWRLKWDIFGDVQTLCNFLIQLPYRNSRSIVFNGKNDHRRHMSTLLWQDSWFC